MVAAVVPLSGPTAASSRPGTGVLRGHTDESSTCRSPTVIPRVVVDAEADGGVGLNAGGGVASDQRGRRVGIDGNSNVYSWASMVTLSLVHAHVLVATACAGSDSTSPSVAYCVGATLSEAARGEGGARCAEAASGETGAT